MNRGGQPGNNNGGSGKTWHDALDKAVKQYTNTIAQAKKNGLPTVKQGEALFKIATRVVAQALDGNVSAIAELGNRLDGKAHQSMDIGITDNTPVEEMTDADIARELAASGAFITRNAGKKNRKAKSARLH